MIASKKTLMTLKGLGRRKKEPNLTLNKATYGEIKEIIASRLTLVSKGKRDCVGVGFGDKPFGEEVSEKLVHRDCDFSRFDYSDESLGKIDSKDGAFEDATVSKGKCDSGGDDSVREDSLGFEDIVCELGTREVLRRGIVSKGKRDFVGVGLGDKPFGEEVSEKLVHRDCDFSRFDYSDESLGKIDSKDGAFEDATVSKGKCDSGGDDSVGEDSLGFEDIVCELGTREVLRREIISKGKRDFVGVGLGENSLNVEVLERVLNENNVLNNIIVSEEKRVYEKSSLLSCSKTKCRSAEVDDGKAVDVPKGVCKSEGNAESEGRAVGKVSGVLGVEAEAFGKGVGKSDGNAESEIESMVDVVAKTSGVVEFEVFGKGVGKSDGNGEAEDRNVGKASGIVKVEADGEIDAKAEGRGIGKAVGNAKVRGRAVSNAKAGGKAKAVGKPKGGGKVASAKKGRSMDSFFNQTNDDKVNSEALVTSDAFLKHLNRIKKAKKSADKLKDLVALDTPRASLSLLWEIVFDRLCSAKKLSLTDINALSGIVQKLSASRVQMENADLKDSKKLDARTESIGQEGISLEVLEKIERQLKLL